MSGLLQKVENFFRKISFNTNQSILLACSGGRDSMALATALLKLQANFSIAHCNFKLRGEESDEDEAFVQQWSALNKVTFFSTSFNTRQYAAKRKLNIQLAARELRYRYFDRILQEKDFDYIATAHHLQDSLENLLIRLGRGSGFKGLTGIPDKNGKIIRPLNEVNQEEILGFTKEYEVNWREDSSNQTDEYLRNTIRHHVIPQLQKAIPDLEQKWETSFGYLKEDWRFFEGQLQARLGEITKTKGEKQRLLIPELLKIEGYPSLLHYWLSPYGNFDLSAILSCLSAESGKTFQSETHRLLKDRNHLLLEPKTRSVKDSFPINDSITQIDEPLLISFEKKSKLDFRIDTDENVAALDSDKLQFPLTLRRWKAGDRFYPLGLSTSKKVSDFFIDQKVDRFAKEQTWLLCSGKEIVWIVGWRIDDRYKITDKTKTVYLARLLKRNPS